MGSYVLFCESVNSSNIKPSRLAWHGCSGRFTSVPAGCAVRGGFLSTDMNTYRIIARALRAKARCIASGNDEWNIKWTARLDELVHELPSGSGFDKGTQLDNSSTPEKLVFNTAFHHMDSNGFYCGWTEHQVIVTPSLEMGYRMRITGRDYRDIKDFIHESFEIVLGREQPEFKAEASAA